MKPFTLLKMLKISVIKLFALFFLTLLINSCNVDDKEPKKEPAGSMVERKDSNENAPVDSRKKNNPATKKETGTFIELKALCEVMNDYYHSKGFVKFIFIPYRRDESDNVRLFCYALDSDRDADMDNSKHIIGQPFFISEDGKGEDPSTLINEMKYHGLSLSLKQMDDIFKMDPSSCLNLRFVPEKQTIPEIGEYNTYHIYKDGYDSKQLLNPSPPGK